MKPIKYDGYVKGLYAYLADNHDNIKWVFSKFFDIPNSAVKIAFRRDDLELMVLVKMVGLSQDAMIMFTINRLDEYKFNYDNDLLLEYILDDFKVGSRCKKLSKIKNRIEK